MDPTENIGPSALSVALKLGRNSYLGMIGGFKHYGPPVTALSY